MGQSTTVSAKIDPELRKKMAELGVSPSVVIKKALEEEVRTREREQVLRKLEEVRPLLRKAGKKGWAEAVRATRVSS